MQLLFSMADVVIIGDDVWIRIDEKPNDFANDYEREDILHAEGYDPTRSTYDYSTGRPSFSGGGSTGRYPRREGSDGYHFDRARESDPLESWCSAYQDHLKQNNMYHFLGKDDGIRNFQGFTDDW